MPENSVTPQPRHDPRQSVGVEAEIVGEIVSPERHVDDDAACRRRRSGQHGKLGEHRRNALLARELAEHRGMKRIAGEARRRDLL
jgi:hypothetical protein